MSDKPKRRWFQIHLSTAIVLMFVAGGVVWLNMRYGNRATSAGLYGDRVSIGWPEDFAEHYVSEKLQIETNWTIISYRALILDLFISVVLLVGTCGIVEFPIRRRRAQVGDKPLRSWLQIHLSTAIVLMFVAGYLIHINFIYRYSKATSGRKVTYGSLTYQVEKAYSVVRGWPLPAVAFGDISDFEIRDFGFEWAGDNRVFNRVRPPKIHVIEVDPNDLKLTFDQPLQWDYRNLVLDLLIMLSVLFFIAVFLEFLIRRREARKT